jgi:hypothetical protein
MFPGASKTCADYERANNVRVLRLNDGDGVLIDGSTKAIIHA